MTHKTNPIIFRIPTIKEWPSKWFSLRKQYKKNLIQDVQIRKFLTDKLRNIGYSRIEIEKLSKHIKIIIYTSKSGLIIGRGGTDIEKLKKEIKKKFLEKEETLEINVIEEKKANFSAQELFTEAMADLEKRVPYRRVLKKIITKIKSSGVKGGKIMLNGRLDGVEIARTEKIKWGRLPLATIRADIDYASGAAFTIRGAVGIKIWIYKGEVFGNEKF